MPASVIVSSLIHFLLALMVYFFIALVMFGHWPTWEYLLLPIIILIQCLMLFGFALLISSLNVFYRDVSSVTEIILSAWFYLTPIIYPLNYAHDAMKDLPQKLGLNFLNTDLLVWLYNLNPMTPIVVAYRRLLLYPHYTDSMSISDSDLLIKVGISFVFSCLVFAFGLYTFRKFSPYFADEL